MVREIAFIAYAVSDVPRAVAFYRDVLGLEPGETFNDEFVEFNVGSAVCAVDGSPLPGCEPGSCKGLGFEVDDIAAARHRLVERGAQIIKVYGFPSCSACFAQDPDGNRFTLHQRGA